MLIYNASTTYKSPLGVLDQDPDSVTRATKAIPVRQMKEQISFKLVNQRVLLVPHDDNTTKRRDYRLVVLCTYLYMQIKDPRD